MILCQPITANEIAQLVNGTIKGPDVTVDRIGSLTNGSDSAVGFIDDSQPIDQAIHSKLKLILVGQYHPQVTQSQIIVNNVRQSWRRLTEYFQQQFEASFQAQIADSASIHPSAKIGQNVYVGAGAVIEAEATIEDNVRIDSLALIGRHAKIGKDSHIGPGVKIMPDVTLGMRCRVLANAVIGERGFGNVFEDGAWKALPQLGSVVIGDDVEIGASTMIDCGTIDNTVIGNGVKLDNLIQIAHNVVIGDHTAIAGCTVIAGSVTFGKYCVVGGASVFNGHITICDGAQFTGHSSISKSITKPGVYASGFPVMPIKQWHRFIAKLRMLGK